MSEGEGTKRYRGIVLMALKLKQFPWFCLRIYTHPEIAWREAGKHALPITVVADLVEEA